jgi:RNA polymerase sigma-70 factor (ECF subfamily)
MDSRFRGNDDSFANDDAGSTRLSEAFSQLEVPASVIDRARAGELAAFEQIYRRFERPVYTLALRMLADAEAAREVLHDAMLKVFQRIDQYRNDAPFWAWLRQIVMNEALMRLRRDRRFDIDAGAETDEIVDADAPPWVRADALALERALGKLPALTRSVLWMYHVEGYSHPEIADLVGKTVSFSKSQVARGTARLRDLLAPVTEHVSCRIQTSMAL